MATQVDFEVDVSDVEYQQLDGAPWLARVYRPRGTGPFPTLVDVHGGAWNNGDRNNDAVLNQALAERGVLTVAIDFRQPPQAGYPASVCDLNLAIRWLKAQRDRFRRHIQGGRAGRLERRPPGAAQRYAPEGPALRVIAAGGPRRRGRQPGVRHRLLAGVGSAVSVRGRPARRQRVHHQSRTTRTGAPRRRCPKAARR